MAMTILTVDDSQSVRRMLTFTLRGAGYTVLEAGDGAEGLRKATAQKVDLVLTDQNMPNLDGLTLVRSLRSMEQYRKLPILMLTTESSEEMKKRGREAGATGWLVKPFDPARLVAVVKKVMG
ncbi:MAG: response regulator [Betaproteobacteria bacterium]|nr:response regulator [Betaproteobacteria bacterium]